MRYLITSALPYINGIKHLGNLVGSMLPADVYTRFLRKKGHEVLFICGTDEHGTPAEIAALKENKSVQKYCDEMFLKQKSIYQSFDLSFDYFGRSSSQNNHELTQEIFLELDKAGFIEEKTIKQFYSLDDERFLPDRYVMGTCPHCHYESARGDQCDGCGALLDPTDLLNPYSSLSKSKNLELRQTKHLFLKLEKIQTELKDWIDSQKDWPHETKGIAYKWLQEGLKKRCITRDLKWGIKVPKKGFEDKVFYVWFDAPIAYISMTQDFLNDDWQKWWKNPKDVYYTQFMAKDNVAFHAIFFPAVLLATNQNWKLVDCLKSMSWLTYENGKFSTSQSRGVFMDQALELFPTDYWRYYLMSHIPESSDSDFTFQHFAQIINKDLADILGNLINRVFSLVHRYFEGQINFYHLNETLEKKSQCLIQDFDNALEKLKFRQAMQALRSYWVLGNEFVSENEPWFLVKNDKKKAEEILAQALLLIKNSALLASCIIPQTSEKILKALGSELWKIEPLSPLFKKISPEEVAELTKRF